MDVDGSGFGERLRACREAAGLSQQELAARAELSIRAVSNMERGRTQWPYRATLTRLADALGLRERVRAEFLAAVPRRQLARPLTAVDADMAGRGPRTAPVGGGVDVPRQLPARVRHFTGRAAELAELDQLLGGADVDAPETVVISALAGTAGVGKPKPKANTPNRYRGVA
ncbi:MAG TPA: helix-turn-helix domain-containing protein [Streptosporangiaceae bacterium]